MDIFSPVLVWQGSTAISSADLFGSSADNSSLDVAATDLINRLSFQVCCATFNFFPVFEHVDGAIYSHIKLLPKKKNFFLLLSITICYHFYTVPIRVTASAFVFLSAGTTGYLLSSKNCRRYRKETKFPGVQFFN